jgi:hypothetical protein
MSGGPFRDTLAPAIADAERQLAELRHQRAQLEGRYEEARMRLDSKVLESAPRPVPPPRDDEDIPLHSLLDSKDARKAAIAGVLVGLLGWIPLFVVR